MKFNLLSFLNLQAKLPSHATSRLRRSLCRFAPCKARFAHFETREVNL